MDFLIYLANLLYLASYFVRDMPALRLFSLLASFCLVGYFASRPEPLVTVIAWNLVFAALNMAHLLRLAIQRLRQSRRRHPLADAG